jgi:hypothetical protein
MIRHGELACRSLQQKFGIRSFGMAATMATRSVLVKQKSLQWGLVLACAALLFSKFWLIYRVNINWDEFYFLNLVHALARGELTQGLQTAYARLFGWLPSLRGDEIGQILVARTVMVVLLGASAWMIQRLASRWLSPPAAWISALAFLSLWPSMKHGGSFRADSMLLPLQLASLLVLTRPGLNDRVRGTGAGVLLGAATAVTIKAVLLAPVVIVLSIRDWTQWRRELRSLVWLAAAAAMTAAALLGGHLLSMAGAGSEGAVASARGAWEKTILSTPWLPQAATLSEQFRADVLFWIGAGAGLAWAMTRRLWPVAGCALSLLPILFYRNSYAYFFVVMWAPACIAIGAAAQAVQEFVLRRRLLCGATAVGLFAAVLAGHGLRDVHRLSSPRQMEQRQLVSAVHQIFPESVAYIDHSGVMASFRKANFFMSTWGVSRYREVGEPFMPAVLQRDQPPLLISLRGELLPGTFRFQQLLKTDREMIERFYQPYWGPVRIAGAAVEIGKGQEALLVLPFGGRYRLESNVPVFIDGQRREPGDVIAVPGNSLKIKVETEKEARSVEVGGVHVVRLLWAAARPPPKVPPVSRSFYEPL